MKEALFTDVPTSSDTYLFTMTHNRDYLVLEERGQEHSLERGARMVMHRLSRRLKSEVRWCWGGGRQSSGYNRNHIHIFAKFVQPLEEGQVRSEFKEAVIKCLDSKYDWDLNLDEAAKALIEKSDKDKALEYVLCDRNPIISNGWIETYPSSRAAKQAKKNQESLVFQQ